MHVFGGAPGSLPASHYNCGNWTYETHPKRPVDLASRCERVERAMQRRIASFASLKHDTRMVHKFLFRDMVPSACSCIAGTFRGDASCKDIENSSVYVDADTRVGAPPRAVAAQMLQFEQQCHSLVQAHAKLLGKAPQPAVALAKFVHMAAIVLQRFLTIHPFKDGNGHTGRFLIYLMMTRAGYAPVNWSIDAKQPYSDALSRHRDGDKNALQQFLLQAIVGAPNAAPTAAPVAAAAVAPTAAQGGH